MGSLWASPCSSLPGMSDLACVAWHVWPGIIGLECVAWHNWPGMCGLAYLAWHVWPDSCGGLARTFQYKTIPPRPLDLILVDPGTVVGPNYKGRWLILAPCILEWFWKHHLWCVNLLPPIFLFHLVQSFRFFLGKFFLTFFSFFRMWFLIAQIKCFGTLNATQKKLQPSTKHRS